jgi:hypothetical protein
MEELKAQIKNLTKEIESSDHWIKRCENKEEYEKSIAYQEYLYFDMKVRQMEQYQLRTKLRNQLRYEKIRSDA